MVKCNNSHVLVVDGKRVMVYRPNSLSGVLQCSICGAEVKPINGIPNIKYPSDLMKNNIYGKNPDLDDIVFTKWQSLCSLVKCMNEDGILDLDNPEKHMKKLVGTKNL